MIGWSDVYKVVAAMAPLYFALALGYCSVRRWKLFTPGQFDAVNRLVAYFFAFDFSARIDDPYGRRALTNAHVYAGVLGVA